MSTNIHDIFESTPCTRCYGNAGAFQRFGHVAGGRCLKCMGQLRNLTRHGQKNYDAWRAAVDAVTVKPFSALKVGDYVRLDNFKKYYKVTAISEAHESGRWTNRDSQTGVETSGVYMRVDLTFDRKISIPTVVGPFTSDTWEADPHATIRIHPGAEHMPQPEAFVTVKKARKTKAVAA